MSDFTGVGSTPDKQVNKAIIVVIRPRACRPTAGIVHDGAGGDLGESGLGDASSRTEHHHRGEKIERGDHFHHRSTDMGLAILSKIAFARSLLKAPQAAR